METYLFTKTAFQFLQTKTMADSTTHLWMDADQPMQTERIYLSSDEDTASQYPMSGHELTEDDDGQRLNKTVIHPNDPTDAAPVTIPAYDLNMTTFSPSATRSKAQLSNHKQNVSPTTTSYYLH